MIKQTVLWTALPAGLENGRLRLSVFVSPRLETNENLPRPVLGQFPDFLKWPDTVQNLGFEVYTDSGAASEVQPDLAEFDPGLWERLFIEETYVRPHEFDDYSQRNIRSFPVRDTLAYLKALYQDLGERSPIPIWDASGKVIAFGGRALEPKEVKYLNSPETGLYRKGAHLYGLNVAGRSIRERKVVIVVEGYFDAITLHAYGFDNAVAALGTALTTDQARLLGRYAQTVVLLFDPDAPGIGAARRNLEHLINVDLNCRIVLLSGGLDPDAFLRKHGAAEFQAALDGAQDLVEFFLDRRVWGLDLNDPVERARAVDGLLDVVGLIDSPVRREGYVQRIAQRGAISDRTLLEAVAQRRARIGRQDAKAAPPPAPVAPPTAEEQLVFIGLHHPAHRARIAAALSPEEIRDPILQRIFVEFVQRGTPESRDGGARPMSLQPPEVQRRLSSLWAGPGEGDWMAASR